MADLPTCHAGMHGRVARTRQSAAARSMRARHLRLPQRVRIVGRVVVLPVAGLAGVIQVGAPPVCEQDGRPHDIRHEA
jgi:hypothetical protein